MYFAFVILVVLIYFLIQNTHLKEEKKRKRFCFCAFLVILFVHLFKDNSIYPDFTSYEIEFDGVSDVKSLAGFFTYYFRLGGHFHEIGWTFLNFLCSRFTNDFDIFLIFVSIGICSGYSYGIYKSSRSPLFSFLFLMLYQTALPQSFYVLRQHLAAALFFMLIPSIINNNYKKLIPGYAIVVSLHYSAAILLPFLFFFRLDDKLFSFKRIVFSMLILVGVFALFENMTYERYADNIEREQGNALGFILTGGVFGMLIISRDVKRKVKLLLDKSELFIQTYMFYSVIICFAVLGTDTGRLTNYFTIFLFISIPYVVRNFSKSIRITTYSVFIAFCVIMALLSNRSFLQYQLIFLN